MSAESVEIHAAASVNMDAGGAGSTYVWQSGAFTGVITDTAAGNIQLLLQADKGIDAAECAVIITARATLAASGLTTYGCRHTSDVLKQITCLQEAAMGAASALTDVDFDITIYRNKIL